MKVLWSSVGPVIIIYSQHIDNAPTQTLQGISHTACADAAVPQIVQTTGQSPEPHNSLSGEKGKKATPTLLNTYFKEVATRDTVHLQRGGRVGFDSKRGEGNLGHLNANHSSKHCFLVILFLQSLYVATFNTCGGKRKQSYSIYAFVISMCHSENIPIIFAT